jgi:SAM-dependent methyltransferase
MLRIDLGCGTNKQTGFIGVDRYPLPGVDILADMNGFLPFREDSVDLLFASHSLEHVKTLLWTIREVYRICKHGAQVCVCAPYSEQKLNLANPYHTCVFNEHTPRFWTDYPTAPIDPAEYAHPHATQWGLSTSDHSDPGIDIRLVRIEYFYFPQYAGLSPPVRRRLRQSRMDVCDQIMYHLIVWKGAEESSAKPFDEYVAEFQPYEPEYLPLLRNRGEEMLLQKSGADVEKARAAIARLEGELAGLHQVYKGENAESGRLTTELTALKKDRDDLQARGALLTSQLTAAREAGAAEAQVSELVRRELAGAKDEINELRAHTVRLTGEITRLHEHCAAQTEVVSRATIELHDTAAYNRILRDEAAGIGRELESARVDLRREAAGAAASQADASSLMGQVRDLRANLESNDVLRAKLGLTRAELETVTALLGLQRQKEEALGSEVAAVRREAVAAAHEGERWKTLWGAAKRSLSALCAEARTPELAHMVRAGGFLIGRDSQHQGLPKRFVALREYCDGHFHAARACLVLSNDLSEVPYREYAIPFELDRLTSVSLAIRPLLPGFSGIVGIEIVSADSEILTQVCLQLAALHRDGITEFQLPAPLTGLKKNWLLRVFVKDVDAPVQVYELARGALLRGATQFFPCVLFQ